MPTAQATSAGLLLATVVACTVAPPPPPLLKVTSPARGMVQSEPHQLMVTGTVQPATSDDHITSVKVNHVAATVHPDGSFVAMLDAPRGAVLLETVATSDNGGSAVDARAVQTGELHAVGADIPRAVTAALSADAFARLSAAAGPLIKTLNLSAMLAPYQPMINTGDSLANLKLSVSNLKFGNTKITLAPVDGGLSFSAEIDALAVTATVAYGGTFIPDGSSVVNVSADQVTVGGTLIVTPSGTAGFTTKLVTPTVHTVGLKLQSSGLTGQILDLLNSVLASSLQTMVTKTEELALAPLLDDALGALAGPQQIDVLGKKLDLQASPSAVSFTRAGALVTMNLKARLEGSESSPGFIFTDNGAPAMDPSHGIQLGLADDLVNEMLAQVHAVGILDLDLQQDFGVFDDAKLKLSMPPMISANTSDGALRLVLGDMVATLSKQGKTVVKAAVNAQVDLKIAPGDTATNIALQFGAVDLRLNLLDDASPDGAGGDDLSGAASAGIGVQLDSLSKLLIQLPIPSLAGIQLENLSIGADSGYVMVAGQIH